MLTNRHSTPFGNVCASHPLKWGTRLMSSLLLLLTLLTPVQGRAADKYAVQFIVPSGKEDVWKFVEMISNLNYPAYMFTNELGGEKHYYAHMGTYDSIVEAIDAAVALQKKSPCGLRGRAGQHQQGGGAQKKSRSGRKERKRLRWRSSPRRMPCPKKRAWTPSWSPTPLPSPRPSRARLLPRHPNPPPNRLPGNRNPPLLQNQKPCGRSPLPHQRNKTPRPRKSPGQSRNQPSSPGTSPWRKRPSRQSPNSCPRLQ